VLDANDPISDFTTILSSVAEIAIPKSKSRVTKHNTSWFNGECTDAIKSRKKALNKVKLHPTITNVEKYKIIGAKCRRTIKTTK